MYSCILSYFFFTATLWMWMDLPTVPIQKLLLRSFSRGSQVRHCRLSSHSVSRAQVQHSLKCINITMVSPAGLSFLSPPPCPLLSEWVTSAPLGGTEHRNWLRTVLAGSLQSTGSHLFFFKGKSFTQGARWALTKSEHPGVKAIFFLELRESLQGSLGPLVDYVLNKQMFAGLHPIKQTCLCCWGSLLTIFISLVFHKSPTVGIGISRVA